MAGVVQSRGTRRCSAATSSRRRCSRSRRWRCATARPTTAVYRSRDDRYKFHQMATFEDKLDWERYWYGEEFAAWRTDYLGWYQVPVVYTWADLVISGSLTGETERLATAPPEGDTI